MKCERMQIVGVALACLAAVTGGCGKPAARTVAPIPREATEMSAASQDLLRGYDTPAWVYRAGRPDDDPVIYRSDGDTIPDNIDDTNLVIFAEGSSDMPPHFLRTAQLLAESPYHPHTESPNLLIVLIHWSESMSVVAEHLNYEGQEHGSKIMRRMCTLHQARHGDDGFVGIIGFSAGTRVTQLAFGAVLPAGRPGDKLPTLVGVAEEMRAVDTVVYLGSSLNRHDPLPFGVLKGRFINFVNPRDTHYGDRAPYYAPAGTSPVYIRVAQANLYKARPRTGASANGFAHLATLTDEQQFGILDLDPQVDRIFRMVNCEVPGELIPWSVVSVPILNDDLDTYWNLAPNHYTMVGRGPEGKLYSKTFDQYKDLSFEFVREQVASAVLHGRVYEFDLKSEPRPNIMPALIDPANLILSIKSKKEAPFYSGQQAPPPE